MSKTIPLVGHNGFGPPFLFVEGLLSTGPTPSTFYLLVEMRLPLHFFSIHVVRTRSCLYERHHNTDTFRGIFGFLSKKQNESFNKTAVIMCCQIVHRKSVAPSSSDLHWRPATQ